MMLELADQALGVLAAAAEEEDDPRGLAALLLLAGPAFYGAMYLRYRNSDKRHRHESETKSEMANVQAQDNFVRSMTGLRNRRMRGANEGDVRGALRKLF